MVLTPDCPETDLIVMPGGLGLDAPGLLVGGDMVGSACTIGRAPDQGLGIPKGSTGNVTGGLPPIPVRVQTVDLLGTEVLIFRLCLIP